VKSLRPKNQSQEIIKAPLTKLKEDPILRKEGRLRNPNFGEGSNPTLNKNSITFPLKFLEKEIVSLNKNKGSW